MRRTSLRSWLLPCLLTACGPGETGLPAKCAYIDPSDTRFVACAGSFSVRGAHTLCPDGYTTKVPDLPASLAPACETFREGKVFFAADVPVSHDPLNYANFACSARADWKPGFMGCGGFFNTTTKPGCGGWPVGLVCAGTFNTWICGATLEQTQNLSSANGVICYKP